ncbi:hypothetical protein L211DRAFT_851593 [Terfezia boudieri ATCC MYA-4762]|uniref:Uncharacterized protein n=1 Tax=Terfezia boudieri ATCC MYA-4762 TaxID=1051890 RepID=A0A3N4LEB9_9PEZI|nr:hypothetical protein L211DRAFT_851593 [Terfezia boudieri ATCC MYA-4762]
MQRLIQTKIHESINLLHALYWGVDAWKTGVKTSSLEHCFVASQVKIHGPFLPGIDLEIDMPEVEEEILECIHVVHLGHSFRDLNYSINLFLPLLKLLKIRSLILKMHSWQPIFLLRPMNQKPKLHYLLLWLHPMQLYHAALSCIESLLLFSLQGDPSVNTTALQDALKREKKRIEILEMERRRQHVQRRITDFLGPSGASSSSSCCLSMICMHVYYLWCHSAAFST